MFRERDLQVEHVRHSEFLRSAEQGDAHGAELGRGFPERGAPPD